MKHIGILKADSWISILNWVGFPLVIIYFISMFIVPIFNGEGDWIYVQGVWDRWQSLNLGVLAFTSSLVAFNIARFNAEKKRAREFVSARAFLPEALSELASYLRGCSPFLKEAWRKASDRVDGRNTPLDKSLPQLPPSYKEIFSRCIVSSEEDVGEHLAYILMRLQVHHSRLQSLEGKSSQNRDRVNVMTNIETYMYRLGELQALVNKTFNFARNESPFNNAHLELRELTSAYFDLGIEVEDYGDLYGITQRAVERNSNT